KTAAPTASAMSTAMPRKRRNASGMLIAPRWPSRSIGRILAPSIRLAELVHVLRNAAQAEIETDLQRLRFPRYDLGMPGLGAVVPDHQVAAFGGETGQFEAPILAGAREMRRVQHEDVADHRMVHVAVDAYVAGARERDHGPFAFGIQTDV